MKFSVCAFWLAYLAVCQAVRTLSNTSTGFASGASSNTIPQRPARHHADAPQQQAVRLLGKLPDLNLPYRPEAVDEAQRWPVPISQEVTIALLPGPSAPPRATDGSHSHTISAVVRGTHDLVPSLALTYGKQPRLTRMPLSLASSSHPSGENAQDASRGRAGSRVGKGPFEAGPSSSRAKTTSSAAAGPKQTKIRRKRPRVEPSDEDKAIGLQMFNFMRSQVDARMANNLKLTIRASEGMTDGARQVYSDCCRIHNKEKARLRRLDRKYGRAPQQASKKVESEEEKKRKAKFMNGVARVTSKLKRLESSLKMKLWKDTDLATLRYLDQEDPGNVAVKNLWDRFNNVKARAAIAENQLAAIVPREKVGQQGKNQPSKSRVKQALDCSTASPRTKGIGPPPKRRKGLQLV
ncbi:hypothetical protein FA10DRAFT_262765 [Acaromyces ingoldii]|uniref:BZIP domain-containing protein n=1 Tax=Acaromyces ingoldii TaxID=215250 RepID=A0A316YEB2_9BASI|nr:hypothetical protein FA10DRAFT_262765 [Acaromyces ingoldii]PWN86968.1 hypothetical protein FA10DRAFT_262765 [Acaromyces ingoldii]